MKSYKQIEALPVEVIDSLKRNPSDMRNKYLDETMLYPLALQRFYQVSTVFQMRQVRW